MTTPFRRAKRRARAAWLTLPVPRVGHAALFVSYSIGFALVCVAAFHPPQSVAVTAGVIGTYAMVALAVVGLALAGFAVLVETRRPIEWAGLCAFMLAASLYALNIIALQITEPGNRWFQAGIIAALLGFTFFRAEVVRPVRAPAVAAVGR